MSQIGDITCSYVVDTTMYTLNQCSTRALHKKISYEAWYGTKPNVNHFRVFGCLAYVHVNDELRKK